MDRRPRSGEKPCADCPKRSLVSRFVANATGVMPPEDCQGKVTVSRGTIVGWSQPASEPWPDRSTWNVMTCPVNGEGDARYSRTEWQADRVCGREEVVPQEGEVPYAGLGVIEGDDGQRYAAYVKGSEQDIACRKSLWAIMSLLGIPVDNQ